MIRYSLLTLLVVFSAAYSWKDWFKGTCIIILLLSVIEHPDMPRQMLGIRGLNPFNFLIINAVASWFLRTGYKKVSGGFQRDIKIFLILYGVVVLIAFFRLILDYQSLVNGTLIGRPVMSKGEIWSEYFFNSIKWVLPGLLIYSGCDTEAKARLVLYSILTSLFVLSLLVLRNLNLETILHGYSLTKYGLKLDRRVGYHRVEVSMLLGGAFWAMWVMAEFVKRGKARIVLIGGSFIMLIAQAMTGGRGGYLGWLFTGLSLGFMKWRKLLLIIPVAAVIAITLIPPVKNRVLHGLKIQSSQSTYTYQEENVDPDELSAGRLELWPIVIQAIKEKPLMGYGRLGFIRSGAGIKYYNQYGGFVGHPHNAYLEFCIDTGLVGLGVVLFLFYKIVKYSSFLFVKGYKPIHSMVGGVALAFVISFLVASLTAQTFFPREGSVWMYCAVFVALRTYKNLKDERSLNASP